MGEFKTEKGKMLAAQERADNWVNMVNGLGDVGRDRTAAARFHQKGATGNADVKYWENVFAEDPIAHRIAALPAKEMVRQGFRMDLGDMSGDMQAPIMAAYDKLGGALAFAEGISFARALGGAAIFVGADDDRALDQPLDLKRVRSVNFLKVLSRQNLVPETWYTAFDPKEPKAGEPEIFSLNIPSVGGATGQQHIRIHESRLLIFHGNVTTAERRARQQGWGDSVYVQTEQSLSLLWQSVMGLANAISDADQAVFSLEGLLDILKSGSEGDEAIRKRLSLLQHGRSVARAVALDAQHEKFEYVARSFAGYDTGLYALMYILSAACGIPVTLLFGRSPAGLNATGDSDVRFFYDTIKSEQELRLGPQLRRLLEVLFAAKDGPTKGVTPAEWSITFRPLMQSSPVERADIRLKTAQADQIEITEGVISAVEAAQSHYGGDEYDQDITLDPDLDRDEIVDDAQPPPPPAKVVVAPGAVGKPAAGNAEPTPVGDMPKGAV